MSTSASPPNPAVDFYFRKSNAFTPEKHLLRQIALASGLTEELKWGHPCYTLEGRNVVLIHAFNDYVAYLLHKGVLLEDPENILIQQTENVQAGRQIRLTGLAQVQAMQGVLADYIARAIAVEKSGAKVPYKEHKDYPLPQELVDRLDDDPGYAAAFHALTPGRQRGYTLHFGGAKQSKTRADRIEKCRPAILQGKGMLER